MLDLWLHLSIDNDQHPVDGMLSALNYSMRFQAIAM